MALALFLLIASATAISFGGSGSVDAGVSTDLSFLDGLSLYTLKVKCDVDTTITFDAYATGSISWTNITGANALTIGGSAGYEITTSPTTATCSITITFPGLTAAPLLAAGVKVTVLKYDETTQAALRVGTVDFSNLFVVTATLPPLTGGKGIYLVATFSESFTVSTDIGAKASAWVAAWANQTLQWSLDTAKDLLIEFNSSAQTQLTVTPLKNATYNVSVDLKALGVWFKVDLSVAVSHQSTIKYHYTDAQIQAAFGANVDAKDLRLAYYDTTQNNWVFPSSGYSVDTEAKIVAQVTNHFSEWGVYVKGANAAAGLKISALTLVGLMLFALSFL